MNNVRYILISDYYLDSLKNNFDVKHSLKIILTGIPKYLNSPSNYNTLKKLRNFWMRDFFDLPDLSIKSSLAADGNIYFPFSMY